MAYDNKLLEESIKLKLSNDYFKEYDTTDIVGRIDYAVAIVKDKADCFETEYLLWAESKKGTKADIYESFVQLILTIGKEGSHNKYVPPAYLGAFDAEKIAFIPFETIHDVLSQNDFNWNVTPSNHNTKEFKQLMDLVRGTLEENLLLFKFDTDSKLLKKFIRTNFKPGVRRSRIRITKNNFIHIYQRWVNLVKPTILVDWEKAKEKGISDADFYLADILSEHNCTLKEKLYVLLRNDHYELDRSIDEIGFVSSLEANFSDKQKSHTKFWNHYSRPPKKEYWDYMVSRRDLLVDQGIREFKGAYFTPKQWVELSQQYIASELGEDWQDEYYVWDCAAGTGNLLNGLQNKYNVWASTIDQADVDAMKNLISGGLNLLESHVFQFDFLNDSFDKLPQGLRDIINDEEKRKKLVMYINPPYAEADNRKGEGRSGVAKSMTQQRYEDEMGYAKREIYIQFLARIFSEIPSSVLADFSKLKNLQAPKFRDFRKSFPAKPVKIFIVPANTFDNVKGDFPISFTIWDTKQKEEFQSIEADVYDENGIYSGTKTIHAYDGCKVINEWTTTFIDYQFEKEKKGNISLGTIIGVGNDFQNQRLVRIENPFKPWNHQYQWQITPENLAETSVYFAVRLIIDATWENDRDQFLYPFDSWRTDKDFVSDCIAYCLFSGKNMFKTANDINHWIPFTEYEVDAKERFKSRFMSDYLKGKYKPKAVEANLFDKQESLIPQEPVAFSDEAQEVMNAGRELWKYYHAQSGTNPDASLYDIKGYFQGFKTGKDGKQKMNSDSSDETYMSLIKNLRSKLKELTEKIEPKVYEHGFLKK